VTNIQDDETFFKERGFGKPLDFGEKPCLIVVDVINGFTDPSMPMGSDLSLQITQINKLLDVVHSMDMPAIFTTISYDDATLADSGIWFQKMEGLRTLKTGSDAVEVDPRLNFQSGDTLMIKKYASAFFGTDLISRLTASKIDTVIIVGCTTCGCIRASAVDALQFGYRPIVVEDAVGDRSMESHEQSLFDLRQKYADVLKTDQVVAKLKSKYASAPGNG
jgi:maleamate amidohydrolase